MKCPNCQFENPEGIQFCGKCGTKFEKICPQCDFSNPPEFKFCGKCGHDLAVAFEQPPKDLSFDEKLEKIQRYLPGDLTEKILAQRGKIEGERRQVTVMFCDLKGFTPLSEKLGEEKVYSIIDELFEMMVHEVHEYGGTVNKGTGDGIMALFGAPIAVEDAPQRAIRSALAIQREMTRFSRKLKDQSEAPPLKMRVGIHTGHVVVGTLGNDLRVEFTALGDTVNLAARMEGLAEPGTVYVTEDTFGLTEGIFRFEALGERQVKGKEQPVKAYRVIAPSTSRTRFDVSAERGLTPFVGREKELELLLDGLERAKAGRGQAFSIIGEAGVGKSRFLYEFRKAIGREDVTFLEGKCLSYSQNVAYHPVTDLLKSNFDIREGDEDYHIRDGVKKGLNQLGVDEASTLPYLLELLSVKDSGIDKIPISPEGKKDRMMEAIRRIALKGSEINPLVLAIEDLHWVDRSSEEVLKYLLEGIAGARVLLILTYRPEFVHTWGSRSYHSQITLNRLSNRESLAMVTHILGTDEVETALEELILEKTEGVPFFIEEFIKSLKDLKIIEKKDGAYHLTRDIHDVTIPGTIQDMIMARVDSLPDAARRVLQTGSAIEREFSHELIKRVTGLPEQQLLSHLSLLKDSELLYERGIYPQSTYIFRHALTREVVYSSILAERKKKLHLGIGAAIVEIYKDNLDENYGILAEHYIAGENYQKGAEYCRQAEKKSIVTGSFHNAIAYGGQRVACLERLPQTGGEETRIIDARVSLGLYYIQINRHIEAKNAVEPIVELALQHNHKKRISQIYTILGTYSFLIEEDFPRAFKYLEDALTIAEELNDTLSLVMASYWLGWALTLDCQYEKASYYLDKVLDLTIAANVLWGIATFKSVMSIFLYAYQGNIDLAYRTSDEALRTAEESGDPYSKATAYTSHGCSCYSRGFLDEAEQYLSKACEFCERVNWFSWHASANLYLGLVCSDKKEHQKAQDYYSKAIYLLESNSFLPSFTDCGKMLLTRAKVMNNEMDINLNGIFRCHESNKIAAYEGWMSRYIGEMLLNIDNQHMAEAEDWVKKAIEADEKNGMMFHLGQDYAAYAKLLERKGDTVKTKENLSKAIEIFKECGADGWVKKAEKELEDLSRKK